MPETSKQVAGFTLIEMVIVIVLVGIMSIAVIPRFADQSIFDSRGFRDETLSTLRYAQKTAVAQRRQVCVTFGVSSMTLKIASSFGGGCDMDLTHPNGSVPYTVSGHGNSQYSPQPAAFNFNPDGTASAAPSIQVLGASDVITVVPETGYVY